MTTNKNKEDRAVRCLQIFAFTSLTAKQWICATHLPFVYAISFSVHFFLSFPLSINSVAAAATTAVTIVDVTASIMSSATSRMECVHFATPERPDQCNRCQTTRKNKETPAVWTTKRRKNSIILISCFMRLVKANKMSGSNLPATTTPVCLVYFSPLSLTHSQITSATWWRSLDSSHVIRTRNVPTCVPRPDDIIRTDQRR